MNVFCGVAGSFTHSSRIVVYLCKLCKRIDDFMEKIKCKICNCISYFLHLAFIQSDLDIRISQD